MQISHFFHFFQIYYLFKNTEISKNQKIPIFKVSIFKTIFKGSKIRCKTYNVKIPM